MSNCSLTALDAYYNAHYAVADFTAASPMALVCFIGFILLLPLGVYQFSQYIYMLIRSRWRKMRGNSGNIEDAVGAAADPADDDKHSKKWQFVKIYPMRILYSVLILSFIIIRIVTFVVRVANWTNTSPNTLGKAHFFLINLGYPFLFCIYTLMVSDWAIAVLDIAKFQASFELQGQGQSAIEMQQRSKATNTEASTVTSSISAATVSSCLSSTQPGEPSSEPLDNDEAQKTEPSAVDAAAAPTPVVVATQPVGTQQQQQQPQLAPQGRITLEPDIRVALLNALCVVSRLFKWFYFAIVAIVMILGTVLRAIESFGNYTILDDNGTLRIWAGCIVGLCGFLMIYGISVYVMCIFYMRYLSDKQIALMLAQRKKGDVTPSQHEVNMQLQKAVEKTKKQQRQTDRTMTRRMIGLNICIAIKMVFLFLMAVVFQAPTPMGQYSQYVWLFVPEVISTYFYLEFAASILF